MSLRLSEEEYAELLRRRRGTTSAAATSSVSAGGAATFPIGEGFEEARRQLIHDVAVAGQIPERMLEAPIKKKRAKYGNRRVEIDGMKFDSKHEAGAYIMLAQRMRAGELKCVLRQVAFDLPGGIRYVADFVAIRPDMSVEAVIDAKSEATKKNRVYINKKKQMLAIYGIEIVEV